MPSFDDHLQVRGARRKSSAAGTIGDVHARLPTLALAILALLAPGCGGSDPDEVVRDYFEAVVDRDGRRACDQLSRELRQDIERAPAVGGRGRTCADVMELAASLNPGLTKQDVEDLDITVEEDGDRAVATLENPLARREETIDLVDEDGDWRISTLETRPRG
jgi:hypothetical protein